MWYIQYDTITLNNLFAIGVQKLLGFKGRLNDQHYLFEKYKCWLNNVETRTSVLFGFGLTFGFHFHPLTLTNLLQLQHCNFSESCWLTQANLIFPAIFSHIFTKISSNSRRNTSYSIFINQKIFKKKWSSTSYLSLLY